MSEEEFLARWSRRKRAARAGAEPDVEAPAPSELCDAAQEPEPPPVGEVTAEPELDLASLPSIDSIAAATDITAFLRKGVPQELTRAALRRAWSADPAIRDFVGLAENAWDFNDPNAMPGFGPLNFSETELNALVERIVGGVRKAAEELSEQLVQSENSTRISASRHDSALTRAEANTGPQSTDAAPTIEPSTEFAAVQPQVGGLDVEEIQIRRRHGGALPQ